MGNIYPNCLVVQKKATTTAFQTLLSVSLCKGQHLPMHQIHYFKCVVFKHRNESVVYSICYGVRLLIGRKYIRFEN